MAYHILLDGPPAPEGGRFVEVENDAGKSINAGAWFARTDGLYELVLPTTVDSARAEKLERGLRNAARLMLLMAESPTDRHELRYTNYRGETSTRSIHLGRVYWGSTEFHPEPQLLMSAFDYVKDAYRDFAVVDFIFEGEPLPHVEYPLVAEGRAVADHIATQKEVCLLELSVAALQEELKRQKRVSKQRMKLLQAARAKIQHMRNDAAIASKRWASYGGASLTE